MIVTFLWVGDDLTIPTLMVASVRKAMPRVEIVQCTDEVTPEVTGVSSVRRLPFKGMEELMLLRLRHMAEFDQPTLMLDADALVIRDVRWIDVLMEQTNIDVALTKRGITPAMNKFAGFEELTGKDISGLMPYNTGAVFSRRRHVWQDALRYLEALEPRWHRWFGDQRALALALETERYSVGLLAPGANYTPKSVDDPMTWNAYIVQYKGPKRKPWMIENAKALLRS